MPPPRRRYATRGSPNTASAFLYAVASIAFLIAATGLGFAIAAYVRPQPDPIISMWSNEEAKRFATKDAHCPFGAIEFVQCVDMDHDGRCGPKDTITEQFHMCNPDTVTQEVIRMEEQSRNGTSMDIVQNAQLVLLDERDVTLDSTVGMSKHDIEQLQYGLSAEVSIRESQYNDARVQGIDHQLRLALLESEQLAQRALLQQHMNDSIAGFDVFWNATLRLGMAEAEIDSLTMRMNETEHLAAILNSFVHTLRQQYNHTNNEVNTLTQQQNQHTQNLIDLQGVQTEISTNVSDVSTIVEKLVQTNLTHWDVTFLLIDRTKDVQTFTVLVLALQNQMQGFQTQVNALLSQHMLIENATIAADVLLDRTTALEAAVAQHDGTLQTTYGLIQHVQNITEVMSTNTLQRISGFESALNVFNVSATQLQGDYALLHGRLATVEIAEQRDYAEILRIEDEQAGHDLRIVYLEGNSSRVLQLNQTIQHMEIDLQQLHLESQEHHNEAWTNWNRITSLESQAVVFNQTVHEVAELGLFLEQEIANITAMLFEANSAIANATLELQVMDAKVNALVNISSIADEALNTTLMEALTNALSLEARVNLLETHTEQKGPILASLQNATFALQQSLNHVDTHQTIQDDALENMSNQVDGLIDNVHALETNLTTQSTSLVTLQSALGGVTDRLTAVENYQMENGGLTLQKTYETVGVVCASGMVNSNGMNMWHSGGQATRTATGRYSIVFDQPMTHAYYPVFMMMCGDADAKDSIQVVAGSKTTMGYSLQIRDGASNNNKKYVDRMFSWGVTCQKQILVDVQVSM